MAKLYWDVDQGSGQWAQMRAIVPTASRFDDIITPSKMAMSASRKKYACQIVAARLLNWQADSLDKITHIEEGRKKEPIAIGFLEELRQIETRKIGFVTTDDGRVGASPDRVTTRPDGSICITVEAKCPTPPVQFEYLLADRLVKMEPASNEAQVYKCQRQGQLYVTEADEAIFFSFHERMPPCYARNYRDEAFLRRLRDALDQFNDELQMLTNFARSLGDYQAFPAIATPLDAELGEGADSDRNRDYRPDLNAVDRAERAPPKLRTGHDTIEELSEIIEGEAGNRLSWGA